MATPKRPDPGKGVFETLLVADGGPVELDAHLARLGRSVEEVFCEPAPDAREEVLARTGGIGLGRLRLTVARDDSGRLGTEIVTAEVEPEAVFPGPERGAALRSVAAEGGLGAHKWVDRELLVDAEAEAPGTVPLLVDGDGAALEAGRANVFAVRDGVLITPPLDGRILPGIARARVIEAAREAGIEVREERVALEELRGDEEVFLTGSVRGVEPAVSLDGDPLPRSGPLTERLAAALRRRWLSGPS